MSCAIGFISGLLMQFVMEDEIDDPHTRKLPIAIAVETERGGRAENGESRRDNWSRVEQG